MAQQNKPTHFKTARVDRLKKLYSDEFSASRSAGRTTVYNTENYKSAKSIRDAMIKGVAEPRSVIEASRQLYSTNPVYASVIDYLANIYLWRYKVTPHKVFTKSKAKLKKKLKADEYNLLYSLMLEVVDGLSLETVFPALLTMLFVNGSVYFTTICDEDSIAIDTITLDPKFCRKVADTQFGTAIIQFNFAYFDSLGLDEDGIKEYLKAFPKEFARGYAKYKKDTSAGSWQILDPRFSTGILLNEAALPRYLYLYGGILDYEKYQDNELKRSDNLLKYIVVHKMPHFEDQLIFDVDEVDAIHKSLKRIVETGNEARLITTWGDVHVDRISESDTAENQILSKSYRAIFNNAGLNDNIFASETAEGVKLSLTRDKAVVWKYVQQVLGFYNITVNN